MYRVAAYLHYECRECCFRFRLCFSKDCNERKVIIPRRLFHVSQSSPVKPDSQLPGFLLHHMDDLYTPHKQAKKRKSENAEHDFQDLLVIYITETLLMRNIKQPTFTEEI